MERFQLRALLAVLVAAGWACSGGGGNGIVDPGVDDDPVVATVTVTAPPGQLVPGQTKQLAVTLRDGTGTELTDRAVAYSSSNEAVARVSETGLVTALAAGSTTITATSETKTGTLTVAVREGALIGSAGGTLTAFGGGVRLVVPPGALSSETVISFESGGTLPNDPSQVVGTRVVLGPATLEFAVPAQLRVPYNPAQGPSGGDEASFRLHRIVASDLVSLGGVVDAGANAVTADLSRLGAFAVARAPASAEEACTAPEYRQFDFWLGEWEVNGAGGTPSDITADPGGCAVFENFANGAGRSINLYSPADGMWHQTFFFANGQRIVLIGELVGEEMILVAPNPPGPPGSFNRWTWTPLPDGRVRQLQEQSSDGGATVFGFDGTYSPR